jgi:hypothetical protein
MSSASDADGGGTKRGSRLIVLVIVLVAVGHCLLCGASAKVCPPTFLQGPDV